MIIFDLHYCKNSLLRFRYYQLYNTLQRAPDKHAPFQKRYGRTSQQNFMVEELNQAIMVRSRFRNKHLKPKSETDKRRYNKRRNYCVTKAEIL